MPPGKRDEVGILKASVSETPSEDPGRRAVLPLIAPQLAVVIVFAVISLVLPALARDPALAYLASLPSIVVASVLLSDVSRELLARINHALFSHSLYTPNQVSFFFPHANYIELAIVALPADLKDVDYPNLKLTLLLSGVVLAKLLLSPGLLLCLRGSEQRLLQPLRSATHVRGVLVIALLIYGLLGVLHLDSVPGSANQGTTSTLSLNKLRPFQHVIALCLPICYPLFLMAVRQSDCMNKSESVLSPETTADSCCGDSLRVAKSLKPAASNSPQTLDDSETGYSVLSDEEEQTEVMPRVQPLPLLLTGALAITFFGLSAALSLKLLDQAVEKSSISPGINGELFYLVIVPATISLLDVAGTLYKSTGITGRKIGIREHSLTEGAFSTVHFVLVVQPFTVLVSWVLDKPFILFPDLVLTIALAAAVSVFDYAVLGKRVPTARAGALLLGCYAVFASASIFI